MKGRCFVCEEQIEKHSAEGCPDVSESNLYAGSIAFNYVNVVGTGCDGWLNLFFGERCIALVDDKELAHKIRMEIPERQ